MKLPDEEIVPSPRPPFICEPVRIVITDPNGHQTKWLAHAMTMERGTVPVETDAEGAVTRRAFSDFFELSACVWADDDAGAD